MKYLVALVLLSPISVFAQDADYPQTYGNASEQANATARRPAVIPVVLTKTLDSKKAKVGDEVTAVVINDVMTAGGIVVPRESKLIGKITQANAISKGDGTSALGLSFDRATLKDGTTLNLVSTIQAVIAAPQPAAPPVDSMPDASSGARGGYGAGTASGGPGGAMEPTTGGMAGDVTNSVGSGTGNTVAGLPQAAGSDPMITPRTTGVVGLKNVEISSNASGTVLASSDRSVKLAGGTSLLVNVGAASVAQSPSQPKK